MLWQLFIREEKEKEIQRQRREGHVIMEADIGVMPSQAKESQEPSEAGKGKETFSSRAARGIVTVPIPFFRLLASRIVSKLILLFCHQIYGHLLQQLYKTNIGDLEHYLITATGYWDKLSSSLNTLSILGVTYSLLLSFNHHLSSTDWVYENG